MVYYHCQGDRDVGRPSYGLSAVCAKATKKNKKIIENPLTNHPSCDTIRVQNADGVRRLRRVPPVCHSTRSSRVLPSAAGVFGRVGKGMMCVQVAPPAHTGEQVRVSPKCGENVKVGVQIPHRPQKKLKKVLTNRKVCDIIKIQTREARQKPRARPTRVV